MAEQRWYVWALLLCLVVVTLVGWFVHHLASNNKAHEGEGVGLARRQWTRTPDEVSAINGSLRKRANLTISIALCGLIPLAVVTLQSEEPISGLLVTVGYAALFGSMVPLANTPALLDRSGGQRP